jgi:hypothetical protein
VELESHKKVLQGELGAWEFSGSNLASSMLFDKSNFKNGFVCLSGRGPIKMTRQSGSNRLYVDV